ncbi:MAG TPA: IS1595 family transposase [Bryobacteraceae bacterium]|nr:IS1595 family transposase [Bryobacteraceae bacterium]
MDTADRRYQSEDAARQYLARLRWPDGPVCPHCGSSGRATELRAQNEAGGYARQGVYQCNACREQFSVTVGTVFEDSRIPLHKWLRAIRLMSSGPNGLSAAALQRELELGSWRSASFMRRRIRWAVPSPRSEKETLRSLLLARPTNDMPRPGKGRQKSVWAEVRDDLATRRPKPR